jgi:hypothetical protein
MRQLQLQLEVQRTWKMTSGNMRVLTPSVTATMPAQYGHPVAKVTIGVHITAHMAHAAERIHISAQRAQV